MKRYLLSLIAMVSMALSANAMSYEQARQQALFLTDKMAYELNLTDMQYEAAYEVNLDYLLSVNHPDDLYNIYWERRNRDLQYILFDWQYTAFAAASYFFRPLYWKAGLWHFGIYTRYPHRDYFYFGFPTFYSTYRGAHAWHMNGGKSWYHGRSFAPPRYDHHNHKGMRDGFNRGDYGSGHRQINNGGGRDNHPSVKAGATHGGVINGGRNNRTNVGSDNIGGGNAKPSGGSGNKGGAVTPNNNGGSNSQRFGSQRSSTRNTVTPSNSSRSSSSASSRPSSSASSRPSSSASSRPSSSAGTRSSASSSSRSSGGSRSAASSGSRSGSRSGGASSGGGASRSGGRR